MRLLGHPVHAMVIHFPIALLTMAAMWDVVALGFDVPFCWSVSFWSVITGLAFGVPASVTGLMDYAAIKDNPPAEKAASTHMMLMFGVIGVFVLSLLARGGAVPAGVARQWLATGLDLLGAAILAAGSWYGGELVFRYGIGQAGTTKPK
ncbi:MAG: DUF2231 domain-containing protein [Verrucomicrobia bacterium]|nr:DUF2231 domain-containing protein [Verrucomicrobiota bacterium]